MRQLPDQFDDLRHLKNKPEWQISEDGYSIVPAIHSSWANAKRRVLFVIESMDSADIKAGRLFSSRLTDSRRPEELNLMIGTVRNTLAQSWLLYQEYLGSNSLTDEPQEPDFSIGFLNFNAARYFGMTGAARSRVVAKCTQRATHWIEELAPTDVVIFGDSAAMNLMADHPDVHLFPFTRGWVRKHHIGSHKCRITNTLDLEPLYNFGGTSFDDDDDSGGDTAGPADLLYLVCRHLMNAYEGKMLHSLKGIESECKVKFVDTMDKFQAFFKKLWRHEGDLGFDTETATLEAKRNKFFTHQYCLDGETVYVIPLDHPLNTAFEPDEIAYMHRKLTKFWSRHPSDNLPMPLIVGTNLQFDLKVVRAQYSIPVVYFQAWDVTAGESLLDENVGMFDRLKIRVGEQQMKTTLGNLRNLLASYGCDAYFKIDFSKEQRGEFGRVAICENTKQATDARFYAAFDAMCVIRIKQAQIERSKRIRISPTRSYTKPYYRHVSKQMSNTVHSISTMHQNGSHLDLKYMNHLLGKESPLLRVMADMSATMRTSEYAAKANKILLKSQNLQSNDLFGRSRWVYDISKPDHRVVLFYRVMELEPLSFTDKGKPQVDKVFFKKYSADHKEAGWTDQWQKAQKLYGTYVKGWLNKLAQRLDSAVDACLRPSFGFFTIVTGRLNSFDPSLQQVPSRGPTAKYIKRGFTPPKGFLNIEFDYSANEVRFWAIVAKDAALSAAFRVGLELRQKWIKSPSPELAKELKAKGDIHIQSVFRFFGIWVDKSNPLREAVKAIVFGLIYGKSIKTLMKDIYKTEAKKAELHARLEAVDKELSELIAQAEKETA